MLTEAVIACIVLSALFLLALGIAKEPRSWRRLYQHFFRPNEVPSVNRNKAMDELISIKAGTIAVIILVVDVLVLLGGAGYAAYERYSTYELDDPAKLQEVKRLSGQRQLQ